MDACPLCETATDSDAGYFARAFGEPRLISATGEAMAHALGLCARHGTELLARERWSDGVAHVLRDSIPRLALMLNEDYLREPHVQQALFGADTACPACTYANRAVGRQAASIARRLSDAAADRVDMLCAGHFQLVVGGLAPELRVVELTRHAERLGQTARMLKPLLRKARDTDFQLAGEATATLDRVLASIAGWPLREVVTAEGALDDALELCPTLAEAIACPQACPLCVEAERARRRWLGNVRRAVAFDQDAWLFFPTCPEHLWMVARLGEPGLTAAVLARAISVTLRHVRGQAHALVRATELREEEARIKAEGPEVWAAHKRKRARQKSEAPRISAPRLANCPGCERIEIAVERATGGLLDLLREKKSRDAFGRGYGLCLKHFARVYRIAPKGMVRSLLAEDQKRRLADVARGFQCVDSASSEREATPPVEVVRRTALRWLGGFA